ncbi:MAG: anti-sigma factor domain-containing protein [Marmoricola sp.]
MTAHEIHALSGAYAVDALDSTERALFEDHLAVCAECRAEVASLQAATLQLSELEPVAPPAEVRDRVLGEIKKIRPLPPVVARLERRRPRPITTLLAAAAVLGVVAGGTVVVEQLTQDATSQKQAQDPLEDVLKAADVEHVTGPMPGGASATLYWSSSEHGAVLETRHLPAAPAGHVYQLWFQKNGTMVNAGLLTGSGDLRYLMKGDPGDATAVGVTVEPDGGSRAPTTTPVALMSLSA